MYLFGENKGADQLRGYQAVTRQLICAFVYANSKFSNDSSFEEHVFDDNRKIFVSSP